MVEGSSDLSLLAHGVHYAVLGGGLVGVCALLVPGRTRTPLDAHAMRVAALRESLGVTTPSRPAPAPHEAPANPPLLLPLALVSSAAAAGTHAAVGPEHFRERVLFGLFFMTCALLQLAWCAAVVRRPSVVALRVGLAGNAGLILLWAATRTVGLPFGLLPRPEDIGWWDGCCVIWEVVVVAACALALRDGSGVSRHWRTWHPAARAWAGAAVVVLLTLSLIGPST